MFAKSAWSLYPTCKTASIDVAIEEITDLTSTILIIHKNVSDLLELVDEFDFNIFNPASFKIILLSTNDMKETLEIIKSKFIQAVNIPETTEDVAGFIFGTDIVIPETETNWISIEAKLPNNNTACAFLKNFDGTFLGAAIDIASSSINGMKLCRALIEHNEPIVIIKGEAESPFCGFSKKIISLLESFEKPYYYFNIFKSQQLRDDLKTYADFLTYPQLYSRGELIGGIDVATALHELGQLENEIWNTTN